VLLLTPLRMRRKSWKGFHKMDSRNVPNTFSHWQKCIVAQEEYSWRKCSLHVWTFLYFSEIDSGNILKVPRIRTLDRLLNRGCPWALKGSSRSDALLWETWNLLHLIGYVGGNRNPNPEMNPRRCQPYLQCQPRRRVTLTQLRLCTK